MALAPGDMGRLDHKGRLFLVGRAKEVVVTATGRTSTWTMSRTSWGLSAESSMCSWAWMIPGVGATRTLARPESGVPTLRLGHPFRRYSQARCDSVAGASGRRTASTDGDPKVSARPPARPSRRCRDAEVKQGEGLMGPVAAPLRSRAWIPAPSR